MNRRRVEQPRYLPPTPPPPTSPQPITPPTLPLTPLCDIWCFVVVVWRRHLPTVLAVEHHNDRLFLTTAETFPPHRRRLVILFGGDVDLPGPANYPSDDSDERAVNALVL